jgi:hydroxyacylglutathione hydrolase
VIGGYQVEPKVAEIRIPFLLPISGDVVVERFVNVWLVTGDKTCLVDAGPCGGEQTIVDALVALGRSPDEIALIVNTHEHPDHIGGNRYFKDKVDPEFACHMAAVPWIEDLDRQYRERPIHGFHKLAGRPVTIQRRLRDGDEIDLGDDTTLRVIFTPGHSPGSISLFCPQEGALLVADALQPLGGLPLYLDVSETRWSLERLRKLRGVEKMYASCADRPFEGEEIPAAITASLAYLETVDALVRRAAEGQGATRDPAEITRRVLSDLQLSPPPVMPITIQSILAHLAQG